MTKQHEANYSLTVIQGLAEYKAYQELHGKYSVTNILSQALVHKVKLSPCEYSDHLMGRMESGEDLKFFVLKKANDTVAVAMGWRRGSVVNSPRIQLQSIAVDSEYRGSGMFNILMDSILSKVNDMGFKGVDVEVGINSLIKNAGLYLHLGGNPNEVLFAMDVNEVASKPSHVAKLNQSRSLSVLSTIFGGACQQARL
jgi:hypothetical protein